MMLFLLPPSSIEKLQLLRQLFTPHVLFKFTTFLKHIYTQVNQIKWQQQNFPNFQGVLIITYQVPKLYLQSILPMELQTEKCFKKFSIFTTF